MADTIATGENFLYPPLAGVGYRREFAQLGFKRP